MQDTDHIVHIGHIALIHQDHMEAIAIMEAIVVMKAIKVIRHIQIRHHIRIHNIVLKVMCHILHRLHQGYLKFQVSLLQ